MSRSVLPFVSLALGLAASVVAGAPTIGKLQWNGPVIPGKPNMTLVGNDVADIYDQVLRINPNFVPNPTPADLNETINTNIHAPADPPPYECGNDLSLATASQGDVFTLVGDINRIGGTWNLGQNSYNRLLCQGTSGIYWDNYNSHLVTASAADVYARAIAVVGGCCLESPNTVSGLSSFPNNHPTAAYSDILVAEANCNDPAYTLPFNYAYPGPNAYEGQAPEVDADRSRR
ncbi:hypothetical protein B0T22DRAFT_517335 [Podospora appendiculata]|uniref:Uncharacterized protein n=1 Tax=Podospora appendiculata TaxID=314037 RepID=A0AAE1CA98_9PEZI|nr:hypothetical protein B0T22DRAFT_517335 [Podospora appendiculata]